MRLSRGLGSVGFALSVNSVRVKRGLGSVGFALTANSVPLWQCTRPNLDAWLTETSLIVLHRSSCMCMAMAHDYFDVYLHLPAKSLPLGDSLATHLSRGLSDKSASAFPSSFATDNIIINQIRGIAHEKRCHFIPHRTSGTPTANGNLR